MRPSLTVFSSLVRPTLQRIETYPRPLGVYRKYIEPTDIAHDFGHIKLVRARTEHIPILIDTFKDFLRTETTCKNLGLTEPGDDYVFSFLTNVTRYPFSYFGINNQDEIVGFGLQDIVYKDKSQDPRPRYNLTIANPKDPFHPLIPMLDYGEHRLFELLNVDKYLHNEAAYVPSSLRKQKISSTIYPKIMHLSLSEAVKMGFKYNVGIVTGSANLGNMKKLQYTLHERIPEQYYVDVNGKKFDLQDGEKTAMLISMDMEQMIKKKIFG